MYRVALAALFAIVLVRPAVAAPDDARGVTLFVHGLGLVPNRQAAGETFGKLAAGEQQDLRWTGLVGWLMNRGWAFGGVVRPRGEIVRLPRDLETLGATRGRAADFYMLNSSIAVQQGGLAAQARELATAVDALCRHTGAARVQLVAFSAGGIAARMYLQGEIGGWPYRDNVSRLVSIAVPHNGLTGLSKLGAKTSRGRHAGLAAGSVLMRRLNTMRDLPRVRYFDIVLQRRDDFAANRAGDYRGLVRLPAAEFAALPSLFRTGGDDVVETVAQLLFLTPTAARLEGRTGEPVRFAVCRMNFPLLAGEAGSMGEHVTLHTYGLTQPVVWETVLSTLEPEVAPEGDALERWARQVAAQSAEREAALRILPPAKLFLESVESCRPAVQQHRGEVAA